MAKVTKQNNILEYKGTKMTKKELIQKIRDKKEAADATAKDNFTASNIDDKEVKNVAPASNIEHADENKAGDAAEVAKEVAAAVDPVVPADEDGVSKNGGEKEMTADTVEAEKKKEDNAMKDVINVTDRTYEENKEVQSELVAQLKEAVDKNEKLKAEMKNIQDVCKAALAAQKAQYVEYSTKKVQGLIESIVKIGESMEAELNAEIARGKKNVAKLEATLKASNKVCNILREGLLAGREPKKMVRYESVMKRYTKIA